MKLNLCILITILLSGCASGSKGILTPAQDEARKQCYENVRADWGVYEDEQCSPDQPWKGCQEIVDNGLKAALRTCSKTAKERSNDN
jgi:hypothetical protein